MWEQWPVIPGVTDTETWQHRAYQGTAKDSHHNTVDVWADPVDVAGCLFDPGGSSEPGFGARTVTTPTLYAPMAAAGDRDLFLGRGSTWQVDGEPADWGLGTPLVIQLRKVEG